MNEFLNAMKNKRARKEFLKSLLIGVISGVIDFLVTAIIIYIEGSKVYTGFLSVVTGATIDGLPHRTPVSIYLTANILGFSISTIFNYVTCCFFVYEFGNVGRNKKGFLKFLLFGLIGLTITTVIGAIGYAGIGGNMWVVKIVATALVFVFNFFTRKYFIFNVALIRDDENTIQL